MEELYDLAYENRISANLSSVSSGEKKSHCQLLRYNVNHGSCENSLQGAFINACKC